MEICGQGTEKNECVQVQLRRSLEGMVWPSGRYGTLRCPAARGTQGNRSSWL